jgi:hypothetical protein
MRGMKSAISREYARYGRQVPGKVIWSRRAGRWKLQKKGEMIPEIKSIYEKLYIFVGAGVMRTVVDKEPPISFARRKEEPFFFHCGRQDRRPVQRRPCRRDALGQFFFS